MKKTISVEYFTLLRDERGESKETVTTDAETYQEFYDALRAQHGFSLDSERLMLIVNNSPSEWDESPGDGDKVVFIPPIAGG